MGLHRAGYEVIGMDINHQPNYPFLFIQADATNPPVRLTDFDLIWASPPCQDHCRSPGPASKHGTGWMLSAIREMLISSGVPWIIENVPGAPMRPDYKLCGCMFGLEKLRRERWFETSWRGFQLLQHGDHRKRAISVTGTGTPTGTWKFYGSLKLKDFNEVMGIDWMNRKELSQAIPPSYSEYLGQEAKKEA